MLLPSVFRHHAFSIMLVGRLLPNVATMLQSIAIGWLVYSIARLTHDESVPPLLEMDIQAVCIKGV